MRTALLVLLALLHFTLHAQIPCGELRYVAFESNRFLPFFSPNGHKRNSYQWSVWNTGQTMHLLAESNNTVYPGPATAGVDLGLLEAWRYVNNCASIKVAIVDTGVSNHRDMTNVVRVNFPLGASTPSPGGNDSSGHGTFIAGLISSWPPTNHMGPAVVAPTNLSLLGVAPYAPILSARVDQLGLPGCIGAINWAVTSGARVVNCSWGFPNAWPELSNVCWFARSQGVIIVQAAPDASANMDTEKDYPAAFGLDNVIAVTALHQIGSVATNAAYGSQLFAAPGVSMVSLARDGTNYVYGNGTSFAAPLVCGVIALLWTQHPEWTYLQVLERIRATCDPCATVFGRVNAGRALRRENPSVNPAFQPLAMGGGFISAPQGAPRGVEFSTDLREWIPFGVLAGGEAIPIDTSVPHRFFRSR